MIKIIETSLRLEKDMVLHLEIMDAMPLIDDLRMK